MHNTRTIFSLRKFILFIPSISLVLAACGTSQIQMPTATLPPTTTPPPIVLPTNTPVPSETPASEPSLTPTVALSDVIRQTYTGISIVARDDFNTDQPDFPPPNWATEGDKMVVSSDGTLEFTGKNNIAYYTNTFVSENHAIIIKFKFAPYSHFTIGMDGVRQGVRIPSGQPGFRSIAMEYDFGPIPEFNADTNRYPSYFKGSLQLVPNTWYMYSLTYAPGKQFIIKVWDPANPSSSITATRQMNDMSNANVFIMWADTTAVVTIDDFTIIQFSGITGQ